MPKELNYEAGITALEEIVAELGALETKAPVQALTLDQAESVAACVAAAIVFGLGECVVLLPVPVFVGTLTSVAEAIAATTGTQPDDQSPAAVAVRARLESSVRGGFCLASEVLSRILRANGSH